MAFSPTQHGPWTSARACTAGKMSSDRLSMWCYKWPPRSWGAVLLLHKIFRCKYKKSSFPVFFYSLFNSFTDNHLPPPTPRWQSSRNSRLIITYWLWRVKSGSKMKRSLKTIYHWRQRGFGGRCDINVRLLKPLGVHSCLIAERVIFLDCISLGIKRTTGAYLMRGYFTSRSIQSHSGNMLQLCCKPRVLQACTFAVGFKTIYFK